MRISVIIPSYNGLPLLYQHLSSVLEILRKGDEVLVVDDASTDQTVEFLKDKFKLKEVKIGSGKLFSSKIFHKRKALFFTLVVNPFNQRFAQTVNTGVKNAKHGLVFILNNDVEPRSGIIPYLVAHFNKKDVFGVGCLELEQTEKGGKNQLWFAKGLFFHSRAEDFRSGSTSWVSGGSGIFDRQKWMQLGGFDKDYFPAYWEDIDLSFRAKKQGWKVLFEEKAVVEHYHETTNKSVFGQRQIQIMSFKNGIVFLWKHASWWQKLLHLFWLPYHLFVTNYKSNNAFLLGYVRFVRQQLLGE